MTKQHDFEKGGVIYGKFFPGLKTVAASVSRSKEGKSWFGIYQPGNGTRYEFIFSEYDFGHGPETMLTIVNMRKCMIIPGPMFPDTSIGYMVEKLGLNEGDCYALIPLINDYLTEQGK